MTISAQQVWTEYREKAGGTNHDGTFTLPEGVAELGQRQLAAWQAVANLCNRHATEAVEEDRERVRRRHGTWAG